MMVVYAAGTAIGCVVPLLPHEAEYVRRPDYEIGSISRGFFRTRMAHNHNLFLAIAFEDRYWNSQETPFENV